MSRRIGPNEGTVRASFLLRSLAKVAQLGEPQDPRFCSAFSDEENAKNTFLCDLAHFPARPVLRPERFLPIF